jgi:hypothetical protein
MESMPQDIVDNCYLHSIDGRFVAEAQYGDTLISFTENDSSDLNLSTTVKTESNDKVCASAERSGKSGDTPAGCMVENRPSHSGSPAASLGSTAETHIQNHPKPTSDQ